SSPVYAGHAIKPLRKLVSSQSACSLGQDPRSSARTERPLPATPCKNDGFSFLSSNPGGCPLKGMNSRHLWFWSAHTDLPAMASTPGGALFSRSDPACHEQN